MKISPKKIVLISLILLIVIIPLAIAISLLNKKDNKEITTDSIISIKISRHPVGKVQGQYRFVFNNIPELIFSEDKTFLIEYIEKYSFSKVEFSQEVLDRISENYNSYGLSKITGNITSNPGIRISTYTTIQFEITKSDGSVQNFSFNPEDIEEATNDENLINAREFYDNIITLVKKNIQEQYYSNKILVEVFNNSSYEGSSETLGFLDTMNHSDQKVINDPDYSIQKKLLESTNFKDSSGRQFVVYYVPVLE